MARSKSKPKGKTKTKRSKLDDYDDDYDDRPARKSRRDRDDDDRPKGPPNDAYTGIALLTLVALVGAALFFYLDAEAVKAQPLAAPTVTLPALAPAAG